MRRVLILLTILSRFSLGQALDGINAPASRTLMLTADEAAFTISVAATLDSTQQQVKQALQNAGLPNPTVVATGLGQDASTYPSGAAQILYSATVTIAAGSGIDVAKNLESLRTQLPAPLQDLQYSVAFNPSQATVDAIRQVVMPQLLDDSRKLAQSLAAAAGVKLGGIRSISDSAGIVGGYNGGSASPLVRSGDFSKVVAKAFDVTQPSLPSGTPYMFYLNVLFAVAP